MKPIEILEHFLSHSDWVDRAESVDRVIIGNPEKEVDSCLVTWMPSFHALRTMMDRRIPLLICHEPTFWNHRDDSPADDRPSQDKRQFILDNDLVILRNHDCWDRWPDVGIPWAWAKFLGLGSTPISIGANGYQHRYDIDRISVDDLARRVAARCGSIGEPMVQVTGDGNQMISRIGIGTGCGCDIDVYLDMGCDCSIVCDDGSCYWAGIQRAEDLNHPVIRVNHGTSEEPGMITLTKYICENFRALRVEHLPHGSTFRLVGPERSLPNKPDAGDGSYRA
jgi:putative NIF3 family GTP cyclohydrolase 1 type 2